MATQTGSAEFVRTCFRVVGAGLAVQGALTLLFLLWSDQAATRTHGLLNHDARHGALHLVWGSALLILSRYERRTRWLVWTALVFGIFYTGLGVLGIVVHDPFGLLLGTGENGFHLILGSSVLAVGCAGLRAGQMPTNAGVAARSSGD